MGHYLTKGLNTKRDPRVAFFPFYKSPYEQPVGKDREISVHATWYPSNMEIQSQYEYKGKMYSVHWVEDDPASNLADDNIIHGVHAICFFGDKIVVVYAAKKKCWTPPGGAIESGETYQQAVIREVQEESNMKVLHQEYIGYQDVTDESGKTVRQVRSFCIVEPYADFISDPDGDITEIKLIAPEDFKQYVDWGVIGDEIMKRALELKSCV